jgi:hypothetical protein
MSRLEVYHRCGDGIKNGVREESGGVGVGRPVPNTRALTGAGR